MIDWKSKLVKLTMLKPGWDGYDAPTPTLEALDVAQYFLFAEYPGMQFLTRLSPCVQGGIGMMFKHTESHKYRTVYLEIDQAGCAAAMFLDAGKVEACAVEDDFEGREKFYYQMATFLSDGPTHEVEP
ncbi:MAG: hypothetical protein P4L67_05085 [Candidatus Pacebacteria bacterium]|nr:hypothetical protein [Candidatus Paceibacterota bacterium]